MTKSRPLSFQRANAASTSSQPTPSSVTSPVMTHRVRTALLERLRGAEEAHVRVARRPLEEHAVARPGSARAARASTRDAPRGDTPSPPRARPGRGRRRPPCATGSGARTRRDRRARSSPACLPALVEDAPAGLLPDDLELRRRRSRRRSRFASRPAGDRGTCHRTRRRGGPRRERRRTPTAPLTCRRGS